MTLRTVVRVLVEYDSGETQIIGPLTGIALKFPVSEFRKAIEVLNPTPTVVAPVVTKPKKVTKPKFKYDPAFPMKPRTGKPVRIEGIAYPSVSAAAKALNLGLSVVARRCEQAHIKGWEFI